MAKQFCVVLSLVVAVVNGRLFQTPPSVTPEVEEKQALKDGLSRTNHMVDDVMGVLYNLKHACEKKSGELSAVGTDIVEAELHEKRALKNALVNRRERVERLSRQLEDVKLHFLTAEPRLDEHQTDNDEHPALVSMRRAYRGIDNAFFMLQASDDYVDKRQLTWEDGLEDEDDNRTWSSSDVGLGTADVWKDLAEKRGLKDALARKNQMLSDLHTRLSRMREACEQIRGPDASTLEEKRQLKDGISRKSHMAQDLEVKIEGMKDKIEFRRQARAAFPPPPRAPLKKKAKAITEKQASKDASIQ